MTCNEMVNYLVEEFTKAGLPEPKSDACLLMDYLAGMNRSALFIHANDPLDPETEDKLRGAAAKRIKRIPLQHITGFQSFMGLEIAVNEHVLIPRQDTEVLVEEILKEGASGLRILDVCTGSGCILLGLLHYMNGCEGTGLDISADALAVARENSRRLGIAATFIQSDLFDGLSEDEDKQKYDIIVSNPPYIRSDVIPTLMEEVREHEPMIALDGYEDGLYFYREIIDKCRDYIMIGGKLYFEIGYDQGAEVSGLMEEAGFKYVKVTKDLSGNDRVVSGEYSLAR